MRTSSGGATFGALLSAFILSVCAEVHLRVIVPSESGRLAMASLSDPPGSAGRGVNHHLYVPGPTPSTYACMVGVRVRIRVSITFGASEHVIHH